jgi:hypothetical protein
MDIEKLKYLKKEIKLLEKRISKINELSDEFEKIWDTMRWDCEFICNEKVYCKHNPKKFKEYCNPAICPLDRPPSWSKDKKSPKK